MSTCQRAAAPAAFQPTLGDVSPAAVISWNSFKSLAKPGDSFRLVGDSILPTEDVNGDEMLTQGIITPAATGSPLVTGADVTAWAAEMPSDTHAAGDTTASALDPSEATGDSILSAWDTFGISENAAGDDQMQMGERLEAASGQAEKLLVLAQVTHHSLAPTDHNCLIKPTAASLQTAKKNSHWMNFSADSMMQ